MVLDLQISPGAAIPVYRQIVDQIRRATLVGSARPGDALPSVRALAARLIVNPNTVARAYNELVRDGVLVAQQGRGYFVADQRQVYSDAERERRLDVAVDALLNEALALHFSVAEIQAAVARKHATLTQNPSPGTDEGTSDV